MVARHLLVDAGEGHSAVAAEALDLHAGLAGYPQPNFVPVRPITSRRTQRSGVSPSTSTEWTVPLTFKLVRHALDVCRLRTTR